MFEHKCYNILARFIIIIMKSYQNLKNIRAIGNSYGVILPKIELEKIGVSEGTPVKVFVNSGTIQLVPLERRADALGTAKLVEEHRENNPEFYNILAG